MILGCGIISIRLHVKACMLTGDLYGRARGQESRVKVWRSEGFNVEIIAIKLWLQLHIRYFWIQIKRAIFVSEVYIGGGIE